MSESEQKYMLEISQFPFLRGADRAQADALIADACAEKDLQRRDHGIYLAAKFALGRAIDTYAREEESCDDTPAAITVQNAVELFQVLAERGHAPAAIEAAACCLDGVGTEKNFFLAGKYARVAAEKFGETEIIQDLLAAVRNGIGRRTGPGRGRGQGLSS